MTAPLNYLKIIILFITSSLIIACHSNGSNNASTPEINTFNIFTHEQVIYSFDEVNRISTRRGEFDSGDNKFIELNTDETKQGYEYAAYVFKNAVYLLNYDKESNAAITKLTNIASKEICGLIPHISSGESSFQDKTKSNRSTLNLPIITIEYQQTGASCDPEINFRDTLTFNSVIEGSIDLSKITKTSGMSEDVFGGLVIDYSASAKLLENSTNRYNETGFLGQNISGNKLVFNYLSKSEYDSWETDFYPTTGAQAIHQASNNHVVVQNDEAIFVLNAKNLFTVNTENSDVPIQKKIDELFSVPSKKLDNASAITFNQRQNENNFLIKHENTLYFFESSSFNQIPINETQASQNAQKIAFDLTSDNTTLVIQESNGIQTLLAISGESGQSTTILSATKVDFYIKGNQFYVNTLELESNSGWQAHLFKRLNNNYISTTYNNSRFIYADDLREKRNTIFLLSSDDENSNIQMIKPSLYLFDSGETNGRKKGLTSNKTTVDFSFGKLNTDVEDIKSSIIINDIYGKITLRGINEDRNVGESVEESYYFNPSQAVPNPTLDKQSLSLMIRKTL